MVARAGDLRKLKDRGGCPIDAVEIEPNGYPGNGRRMRCD